MSRPKRKTISTLNLSRRGVPKQFHSITIEDFEDYGSDSLVEVKRFMTDYLDNIDDKFRTNTGLFLYGSNGVGKAQPLYSRVLTKTGWKEMRDIEVGEEVYTREGKLSKVIATHPQGIKDNYLVTLLDGRTTECNDEHLWSYYTSRGNLKTVTLREMIDKGFKYDKVNQYRYKIPNNQAVPFSKKELPIDPYVLGVLIGDDCLAKSQGSITFSTSEVDIATRFAERLGCEYEVRKYNTNNYSWGIKYLPKHHSNPLKDKIDSLNLRVLSGKKFIPKDYLFSSIEDREELLKGLFDTDGHVALNGGFSYSTSSYQLYKDIQHLCRSLGIQSVGNIFNRENGKVDYEVSILTDKEIFTSEKHLKRWNETTGKKRASNKSNYERVPVVSAKYIGRTEMKCITLDSEEQLYITDDFIVTHNSMLASILVKEAYIHRYSSKRVTFVDYVSEYTRVWNTNSTLEREEVEARFYHDYKAVEFLVLEELGKELDSKLTPTVLEDCLRYREERGLPTIVCTNLTPKAIVEKYGNSIASLIKGNFIPINIVGSDKRAEYFNKRD